MSKSKPSPPPYASPLIEPGTLLGAGDSRIEYGLLPKELEGVAFENLIKEVEWVRMIHRGGEVPRLVAQQGEILDEDGSYPIYRHPADESPPLLPFSPIVQMIREHVQKTLNHPVNHVLIQHYRTGADYISDHSDKTIDVVPNSSIVNVSLGAQRVMTLRMKKDKITRDQERSRLQSQTVEQATNSEDIHTHNQVPPRQTQRIPLPHNSLFILGLETNKTWVRGITTDKRPMTIKSPTEAVYEGARISLTFRWIGTFINPKRRLIWGIGAKGKTKEEANTLVDMDDAIGETEADGEKKTQVEKLIWAFGEENQNPEFDWGQWYGEGFDCVSLKTVK